MPVSNAPQVTISLLPISLSLVRVPRSRLHKLSHPVLKQILQPNPTFLNVTCNEIELTLIAEHTVIEDFEPIARRDRQRHRSKQVSSKRSLAASANDPIEISYEKWSVLQIDSHCDQLCSSGARVNELSAPLASAGISILYQSSYMSDFIILKESRLHEALALFSAAGFDLETEYSEEASDDAPLYPPVLTDRGPADARLQSYNESTALNSASIHDTTTYSPYPSSSRFKPQSPTKGEVHMLSPDLACVGLSDELGVDHWGLKIVKLVAFPDLIPRYTSQRRPPSNSSPSAVLSPLAEFMSPLDQFDPLEASDETSEEEDGYFSHSPPPQSPTSLPLSSSRSYADISEIVPDNALKSPSKHPTSTSSSLHLQKELEKVPFFSFTRTAEGSSLTAEVSTLAALFPPHERHMVIYRGELDAVDAPSYCNEPEGDENDGALFKCLQIDLRRFGLDKHGLVNRFSRILGEYGINHMYSSTCKTANLLVDKKHAIRAQALLRSC